MFAPGAMPRLPEIAEPMSVRMSPNRFDADDDVERARVRDHARGDRVDVILPVLDRRVVLAARRSATSSHSTIECRSAFDLVALASSRRGRFIATSKP